MNIEQALLLDFSDSQAHKKYCMGNLYNILSYRNTYQIPVILFLDLTFEIGLVQDRI